MIYKTHYFIFSFQHDYGGGGKNFLSLLKIQNTNWKPKGNEGSLSPPQSALPSLGLWLDHCRDFVLNLSNT